MVHSKTLLLTCNFYTKSKPTAGYRCAVLLQYIARLVNNILVLRPFFSAAFTKFPYTHNSILLSFTIIHE